MKDVEIGRFGETKVYMKLDELFRIANKEVQDFADEVCEDNSHLYYKLDLAVEALNKILKRAKEVNNNLIKRKTSRRLLETKQTLKGGHREFSRI